MTVNGHGSVLADKFLRIRFDNRTSMLHHDWDALHAFTSYPQIQDWLENLSVSSYLLLVQFHAAYLNCKPDYSLTFGQIKSAFWNFANAHGTFHNGKFLVQRRVALSEVKVEYFVTLSPGILLRSQIFGR